MSTVLLTKKSTKRVIIQNHSNRAIFLGGKGISEDNKFTKAYRLTPGSELELKGHNNLYLIGQLELVSVVYI